jgi:uncharacterized protein YjbI with pentapeptide repeats
LRGAVFRRSSLIGANLQFSRSGIASDRNLIFRSLLLILAVLLGLLAGLTGSLIFELLINESRVLDIYHNVKFVMPWQTVAGLLSMSICSIYLTASLWKNFTTAIWLGGFSVVFLGTIVGLIAVDACARSGQPWKLGGELTMAMTGPSTMSIFQIILITVFLVIIVIALQADIQVLIAVAIGIVLMLISASKAHASIYLLVGSTLLSMAILFVGVKVGRRARLKDARNQSIRATSIYIATYFGTCFDQANLTDANLASALLTNTNLTAANLTRTNLYGVQQLNLAKFDRTILTNSLVRNLLVAVMIEIGDRGLPPRAVAVGKLDDEGEVITAYQDWRNTYIQYIGSSRLDIPNSQMTNVKEPIFEISQQQDYINECQLAAQNLRVKLNKWLDGKDFKPIKELIFQELQPSQLIQISIQTDELEIRRLPFQLWDIFDRFTQAEITIASSTYRSIAKQQLIPEQLKTLEILEILAIFGDSQGIDLETDRELLSQLSNANVDFLIEPTRQVLNDKLWSKHWDIIFFAGHSASDPDLKNGHLKINATDRLTMAELQYALKQSIEHGLKLVIINSCDSLGLATELISMQLPQAIVMREPVPDFVAQQFLKYFLIAFASGLPLDRSVRQAREQLQGLEDRYPCASWLPIVCQNPAENI